jgi:hypothetical protein
VLLYNVPMWTTSIQMQHGVPYCHWQDRYDNLMQAVTYIDTCFTLVMPVIIILVLMTAIIYSSFKARKRQKQLCSVAVNSSRSRSPIQKVTRLLFAVSFFFLVLHTPSHVIRIKVMNGDVNLDTTDNTLQRMFQLIYYFNFSLNFLIYLVAGKSFRTTFVDKLCAGHCTISVNGTKSSPRYV